MITLFECWNATTPYWDRINPPQFVFAYPATSSEVVTFLQLSGRICEVLTQAEWVLNMGGQIFDIPNIPENEITNFVYTVRNTMGYSATTIPYQLGNPYTGYVTIQILVWVNMQTGRADMYSPQTQFVYGATLLPPQQQISMPMQTNNFTLSMTSKGSVQGSGAKNVLDSIATIVGGFGKIAELVNKSGIFSNSSDNSSTNSYGY